MNWQWNPAQAVHQAPHPQGSRYWHPGPYYPYAAPPPDYTGATFRNQPLPLYTNRVGNVPLPNVNQPLAEPVGIPQMPRPRPFGNHNQQRPDDDGPYLAPVNDPRHRLPLPHRWGEPVELAYMPDRPQPARMPQPPEWAQGIEHARDQPSGCQGGENCQCVDSAFPGAVPHNNDTWPWNVDNSRLPIAPDVTRRRFFKRRLAQAKLRRRQSTLSRISSLNEFKLAPRPTDWRPDYPARPCGLLHRLSRIRVPKSPRLAGGNYTFNTLLLYDNPEDYPVSYDLRQEPEISEITFMNLDRSCNNLDFCQLATTPPVDELCLWHPRLPWYIHIRASQDNGITIQDVLCQIHDHLTEPIRANHYWNVELSPKDREEMGGAFQYRCDENQKLWSKGIARIDFLRFDCVFTGLAKSRDGMWEIKTKEATV